MEGEIVRWLVQVGDTVQADQLLVEVETDKAVVEIPAPRAGTILGLGAAEGEKILVDHVLVVIGEAGEPAPDREPAVDADVDYEWVMELSERIPTIGLQFSIHEASDERRDKLIPFKKKLTIRQIADVGKEWFERTGRKPFFNYCASDDNSSIYEATELKLIFSPEIWNATVSVICERNEGLPAKNEHQQNLASVFSSFLVSLGFDVRVFDPAGQDDIGGGCGQLWFVQQWMVDNPDKSKPSVGNGLPKVHVPMEVLA